MAKQRTCRGKSDRGVMHAVMPPHDQRYFIENVCFEDGEGRHHDGPEQRGWLLTLAYRLGASVAELMSAPDAGSISRTVAERLVALGYCVYDGERFFEVYRHPRCVRAMRSHRSAAAA